MYKQCDGQRPNCSSCIKRSIDCQWSTTSDGRKPASKSYVQLLRNRIELLECILRSHSIDVDTAVAQYQIDQRSFSATADENNHSSAHFEKLCAAFEGTLSLDESVNFDGDGECHYFGPTSGRLEFQDRKSRPGEDMLKLKCTVQDSSYEINIFPKNISQSFSDAPVPSSPSKAQPNSFMLHIDENLQAELIDLYFVWQNPWFPVLDESLFKTHMQQGGGRYFNPLLLSCVLAAGSRFSERPEVRTNQLDVDTAGDQLLAEAEVLLHFDLKSPSLTTIQAVAIMVYMYIVSSLSIS